jgi:hypothetical protein
MSTDLSASNALADLAALVREEHQGACAAIKLGRLGAVGDEHSRTGPGAGSAVSPSFTRGVTGRWVAG